MAMTVDPRQLMTLAAIVRTGSFAAAADELGYTQSAVSQQVAEIERRVGMRVLQRRPVRVTEAGAVLLDAELAVRTATASAVRNLTALGEGRAGQVRLGAFASAAVGVVPGALASFRASNPDVRVTLSQLETEVCYGRILRGELDLALTFDYDRMPMPWPASITRTLVAADPVLVALPADHPAAASASVRLADLAGDAWIGSPVTADLALSVGAPPRLQFDGDDFQTILGLVDHGLGIALLPQLALLRSPAGVVTRPLSEQPLTRYVYTAHLDTRHTPKALGVLQYQLAETVRAALSPSAGRATGGRGVRG